MGDQQPTEETVVRESANEEGHGETGVPDILAEGQDNNISRKQSSASIRRQSILDSIADAVLSSPPAPRKPSATVVQDFKDLRQVAALLDPETPFLGCSGCVLQLWDATDTEDILRSTRHLSQAKRQKVSRLISKLKLLLSGTSATAAESDGESSASSISTTRDSVAVTAQQNSEMRKTSKASTQQPYSVIFESNEAASMEQEQFTSTSPALQEPLDDQLQSRPESKLSRRSSRSQRSERTPQLNGLKDPENLSSALVALKSTTETETNTLQKVLDVWYGDLRQAVVAENTVAREKIILEFDRSMKDLVQSQQQDVDRLESDIDSLHNLCRSYSKAIHERDKTIANLAEALSEQKEQVILARSFAAWKSEIEHNRHEKFQDELASRYYRRQLMQKAWAVWHAVVKERWRERIEKACQKRAEEVCHQMADQYEAKIAGYEETIRRLQEENKLFRRERHDVNAKAREALLRGVSVLRTEVSHFITSPNGDSQPGSRKGSSGEVSRSQSALTGHSQTAKSHSSDDQISLPRARLKSVSSGPVPYVVEKHEPPGSHSGSSSTSTTSSSRTTTKVRKAS